MDGVSEISEIQNAKRKISQIFLKLRDPLKIFYQNFREMQGGERKNSKILPQTPRYSVSSNHPISISPSLFPFPPDCLRKNQIHSAAFSSEFTAGKFFSMKREKI